MIKPLNNKVQEPLIEVKKDSGFGYYGTLLFDDINNCVQCHICGKWFRSVSVHVRMKHKITARKYKEIYELNYGTALCIPEMSEKRSKMSELRYRINYGLLSMEEIKKIAKERAKKSLRTNYRKHQRLTMEMMNNYGSCPAQVEERFTKLIDSLGYVPSYDEMQKRDHSLLMVLVRRFKGYSKALQHFGIKPRRRVTFQEYGIGNIRKAIRDFVLMYKRLPNSRDTKVGGLPDYMTLRRYFKSFWKVKEYAFRILEKEFPLLSDNYDKNYQRIQI